MAVFLNFVASNGDFLWAGFCAQAAEPACSGLHDLSLRFWRVPLQ